MIRLIFFVVVLCNVNGFSIPTTTMPPPPPSPLSAILFDIDGTLVLSDPIHFAVFRELLLDEEGFNNNEPIDDEFFQRNISGRQNTLIMADLFPNWSAAKRQAWSVKKEARFREAAASDMSNRKMPGLDRLKDWIDTNTHLGKAAVTNAPRLNAEAILSSIKRDTWFTHLIIGDECERAKPDPEPYLKACELLNVSPKNCIVFEDSPSGAKAGVAAGSYVVGVLSGHDASTLLNSGCSLVIQDFDDPVLWSTLESLSDTSTA